MHLYLVNVFNWILRILNLYKLPISIRKCSCRRNFKLRIGLHHLCNDPDSLVFHEIAETVYKYYWKNTITGSWFWFASFVSLSCSENAFGSSNINTDIYTRNVEKFFILIVFLVKVRIYDFTSLDFFFHSPPPLPLFSILKLYDCV